MIKRTMLSFGIVLSFLTLFFVFGSKEVSANTDTEYFTFQNGYPNGSQYNLDKHAELVNLITSGYDTLVEFYVDNTDTGNEFTLFFEYIRDNLTGEWHYNFEIRDSNNNIMWRLTYEGLITDDAFGNNAILDMTLQRHSAFTSGYNKGREDFGVYFEGEWWTAQDYANFRIDETNAYWQGVIANLGDEAYLEGLNEGKLIGFSDGYQKAIDDGVAGDSGILSILFAVFSGLGVLLAIELLPNITIGAIIAVPLIFGVIALLIGGNRGKKND